MIFFMRIGDEIAKSCFAPEVNVQKLKYIYYILVCVNLDMILYVGKYYCILKFIPKVAILSTMKF